MQAFSGYPFWTLGYTSFLVSEDGRNGADCLNAVNRNQCDLPNACSQQFNQVCVNDMPHQGFIYLGESSGMGLAGKGPPLPFPAPIQFFAESGRG